MLSRTNCENEVKTFEIQGNTVYIRSNIKQITDNDGDLMWEYEEHTMPLIEYIKMNYPESQVNTDNAFAELTTYLVNYQKQVNAAIAELSILIGGIMNNV